jgi:hypothetical protein
MDSNGNAYYCQRRLARGSAQLSIYTNIQYNLDPSYKNDGVHMAVNMEPLMWYFQINIIPCSAAYGPQIK